MHEHERIENRDVVKRPGKVRMTLAFVIVDVRLLEGIGLLGSHFRLTRLGKVSEAA